MAFDLGRVVRRTFTPIAHNPATFLGLSFVLVGLPGLVSLVLQRSLAQGGGFLAPALGTLVVSLISVATYGILQGGLVHAAIKDYRGGRASFGESLGTGLQHLWPVIAISILYGLAVSVGMLLLIVPGVFLAIIYMVAVPAEVTESTGISGAFRRSRALTKGSRWWLLLTILLYAVVSWGISLVVYLPIGFGEDMMAQITTAVLIGQLVVSTLQGAIAASGSAAVYTELREQREGVMADELASVFA
ncbi:hypothetical protein [Parvularcula dongshanensis]|uniref:Glycerophosphoryl diester phosphodiesterase membrane domain-containing protein n=1 Tax=Parvularcula dongshanensis TaxID=1173995 RepID=A0A840I3W0_9PROT|nr:hypothetical protein [Parvularcula dongshanensis]MBB4659002.1 hypothetical protein [Parvularcula dongshanensis]